MGSTEQLIRKRLEAVPWGALRGLPYAEALREVLSGAAADQILARSLKGHREFDADQRQVMAEVVFGVGLWRRRLAARLRGGVCEPSAMVEVFLEDLVRGRYPEPLEFADRHSLPDWLADEISRAYGAEADDFASALNLPGPVCVRANSLLTTREALGERLSREGVSSTPCQLASTGLVLTGPRPNILGLPAHRDGWFEVQDEGSQLVGLMLGARPGDVCLDACAGAGGKTLLVAAQLANRGTVFAFDTDRSRLQRLEHRAQRAGVTCVRTLWELPSAPLEVARALVDAPCSELGALRRGPDLRWRIQPDSFQALPALQLAILEDTQRHVLPGGRLVYATCTFRREENEEVVQAFLDRHSDFTPSAELRVSPHSHGTDGFFGCAMERGP